MRFLLTYQLLFLVIVSKGVSIGFHAIDGKTAVRTDVAAVGTANAFIRMLHIDIMISTVVYLAWLQFQHTGRTGYHAEVTPFAPFPVHLYITLYFRHYRSGFNKNECLQI